MILLNIIMLLSDDFFTVLILLYIKYKILKWRLIACELILNTWVSFPISFLRKSSVPVTFIKKSSVADVNVRKARWKKRG